MVDLVAKQRNYVTRLSQSVEDFIAAHDELMLLSEEYNALDYGNQIAPSAFEGENSHMVIADIVAVMVTHAAIEAVMDAGHRTNLLRTRS